MSKNWIKAVTNSMKRRGTVGAFTKQAKQQGMSTVEFADQVLSNPSDYTTRTTRRAQFMKNVDPQLFAKGGSITNKGKTYIAFPPDIEESSEHNKESIIDWANTMYYNDASENKDQYNLEENEEVSKNMFNNDILGAIDHLGKYEIVVEDKMEQGGEIKESDIVKGATFNRNGTVFIVDKIENDPKFGKLVHSSFEGGNKGDYRDSITDFIEFINEKQYAKGGSVGDNLKNYTLPTKGNGQPRFVTLEAVPNIDHPKNTQIGSINIPKQIVLIGSFKQASEVVRKFIDDNDLGSGNWTGGEILDNGNNIIARVSYNGRVWKGNDNSILDEEINLDEEIIDIVDNYNQLNLPKEVYLNGKKYNGEAVFVNGWNGHESTVSDGILHALINKSAWNNGIGNYLTNKDGNLLRSKKHRGAIKEFSYKDINKKTESNLEKRLRVVKLMSKKNPSVEARVKIIKKMIEKSELENSTETSKYLIVTTWNGEGYSEHNKIVGIKEFSSDKEALEYTKNQIKSDEPGAENIEKTKNGYSFEKDEDSGSYQFFKLSPSVYGVLIFTNYNGVKVLDKNTYSKYLREAKEKFKKQGNDIEDAENGDNRYFFSLEDLDYLKLGYSKPDDESDYQFEKIDEPKGGEEVKFIKKEYGLDWYEYKDEEFFYSDDSKTFHSNDQEFNSKEEVKNYIDSGSQMSGKMINAYRKGSMGNGGSTNPNSSSKYLIVTTWNGEGYSEHNKVVGIKEFSSNKEALEYTKNQIEEEEIGAENIEKIDTGYSFENEGDYGSYQYFKLNPSDYGVIFMPNVNEAKVLNEKDYEKYFNQVKNEYVNLGNDLEEAKNGDNRYFFDQDSINYNGIDIDENESDYQFEKLPKFGNGGSLKTPTDCHYPFSEDINEGRFEKGGQIDENWGSTYSSLNSEDEDYNTLYSLFPDKWSEAKNFWGRLSEKQQDSFISSIDDQDAANEHISDSWLEFVNAPSEEYFWENATNCEE